MTDMGNPFMEETGGLFTLDTKMIAHPSVAEMVTSHYDNGKTRFNEFLKGLDTDECSFYQPSKISFTNRSLERLTISVRWNTTGLSIVSK
jgi:hypothetical protein